MKKCSEIKGLKYNSVISQTINDFTVLDRQYYYTYGYNFIEQYNKDLKRVATFRVKLLK